MITYLSAISNFAGASGVLLLFSDFLVSVVLVRVSQSVIVCSAVHRVGDRSLHRLYWISDRSSEFLDNDCILLLSIDFDQRVAQVCLGYCQDFAISIQAIMIYLASEFDTSIKGAY